MRSKIPILARQPISVESTLKAKLSKPSVGRQLREKLFEGGLQQHLVATALKARTVEDLSAHVETLATARRGKETLELFTGWLERSRNGQIAPPGLITWAIVFKVGFASILSSPEAIQRISRNCVHLCENRQWPDQYALAVVIERFGHMILFKEAREIFESARRNYGNQLKPIVWKAIMSAYGHEGDYTGVLHLFEIWRAERDQSYAPDALPYLALLRQTARLAPNDLAALSKVLTIATEDGVPFDQQALEALMHSHARNNRATPVFLLYHHMINQPEYKPSAQIFSSTLCALQQHSLDEPKALTEIIEFDTWSSMEEATAAKLPSAAPDPEQLLKDILQAQSRTRTPFAPPDHRLVAKPLLTPSVLKNALNRFILDPFTCTVLLRSTLDTGLAIDPSLAEHVIKRLYTPWSKHHLQMPEWYRLGLPPTSRKSNKAKTIFETLAWTVIRKSARTGNGRKSLARGLEGLFREVWRQGGGRDIWERAIRRRREILVPTSRLTGEI